LDRQIKEPCHPCSPNTKRAALGWKHPSDGEAALSPEGMNTLIAPAEATGYSTGRDPPESLDTRAAPPRCVVNQGLDVSARAEYLWVQGVSAITP
jgi:hypothetical protein